MALGRKVEATLYMVAIMGVIWSVVMGLGLFRLVGPSYLSINSNDEAFIYDLANEARSLGDCVEIIPIDRPPGPDGRAWLWLHSC